MRVACGGVWGWLPGPKAQQARLELTAPLLWMKAPRLKQVDHPSDTFSRVTASLVLAGSPDPHGIVAADGTVGSRCCEWEATSSWPRLCKLCEGSWLGWCQGRGFGPAWVGFDTKERFTRESSGCSRGTAAVTSCVGLSTEPTLPQLSRRRRRPR